MGEDGWKASVVFVISVPFLSDSSQRPPVLSRVPSSVLVEQQPLRRGAGGWPGFALVGQLRERAVECLQRQNQNLIQGGKTKVAYLLHLSI